MECFHALHALQLRCAYKNFEFVGQEVALLMTLIVPQSLCRQKYRQLYNLLMQNLMCYSLIQRVWTVGEGADKAACNLCLHPCAQSALQLVHGMQIKLPC